MDAIIQDLRFALRGARQRPGFTAAAIITLGLGVGATVGIFSVVHGVLLRPLPFAEPERLVVVGQATAASTPGELSPMSHQNFLDLQQAASSFEAVALYGSAGVTLTGLGDAAAIPGAQVSPEFFRVLRAEPVLGRTFTAEEATTGGPRAIIITWGFWQERLGGAPDVLEQTLSISGIPRPIVGVTRQGFEFPAGARVFAPIRPNHEACGRGCPLLAGIARLAPGVTHSAAQAELATLSRQLAQAYPATNEDLSFDIRALLDHTVGGVRTPLVALFSAVVMVLLIACANVANLVLARGAGRATELAVRSALGADRSRIVRQMLTENLLLAASGAALGVLLAAWCVSALRAAAPPYIPRVDDIAVDTGALAFALLLVVLTTLVSGLWPAFQLSGRIASPLRSSRGQVGDQRGWGRSTVLAGEVALAVMLLLGAGLMLRTMATMQRVELGFNARDLAAFSVGLPAASHATPEARIQFFEELGGRLRAASGIDAAGVFTTAPLAGSLSNVSFVRTDRPAERDHAPQARLRMVDGGGIDALGARLLDGRNFGSLDHASAAPVVIINVSAAQRFWPDVSAVGRQIRIQTGDALEEQPRTVVGIIGDVRGAQLTEPFEPEIMLPHAQLGTSFASLLIRAEDPATALVNARQVLSSMDPNLLMINPQTLQEAVAAQTASTRFFLWLIGLFASLAVTLAAIGIYGVLAFLVNGRRREIGLRMALGARAGEVVRLVLWQGIAPALVGLAIGIGVALAGGRVIAGLLFGVAPHDPLTIVGVSALLAMIAVLACLLPALRAARVPPAITLRE